MKKKKNHYPDCEINNGGECDCDGNYDPKNQKSWEEKGDDLIIILGGIWLTLLWKPLGVIFLVLTIFALMTWKGFKNE